MKKIKNSKRKEVKMIRILRQFIAGIFLSCTVFILMGEKDIRAAETFNIRYEVTHNQSEAREMLKLINNFRVNGTWYWNADNTTKTSIVSGELMPLEIDAGLEETAMKRAEEIALHYSHTRPNGQDCFSVFPSHNGSGENIACGQENFVEVFEDWKEEEEDYSGQGHRRNMLYPSFRYIGIGCVERNGMKFWTQSFSDTPSGRMLSEADDNKVVVETELDRNFILEKGFLMKSENGGLEETETEIS